MTKYILGLSHVSHVSIDRVHVVGVPCNENTEAELGWAYSMLCGKSL